MNHWAGRNLLFCVVVSLTVFYQDVRCPPVTDPPTNHTVSEADSQQQEDLVSSANVSFDFISVYDVQK
jgi:hypothetical protein